jgi:hypothetical protein
MTMRIQHLLIALAASLLAGCDPMAFTSTRVTIPVAVQTGATQPGTNLASSDFATALSLVDSLMTTNGLVHVTNSMPGGDGLVAAYHKFDPYSPFSCGVFVRTNTLSVEFSQMGRFKPSPSVREINAALKQKLGEHYGSQNVQ